MVRRLQGPAWWVSDGWASSSKWGPETQLLAGARTSCPQPPWLRGLKGCTCNALGTMWYWGLNQGPAHARQMFQVMFYLLEVGAFRLPGCVLSLQGTLSRSEGLESHPCPGSTSGRGAHGYELWRLPGCSPFPTWAGLHHKSTQSFAKGANWDFQPHWEKLGLRGDRINKLFGFSCQGKQSGRGQSQNQGNMPLGFPPGLAPWVILLCGDRTSVLLCSGPEHLKRFLGVHSEHPLRWYGHMKCLLEASRKAGGDKLYARHALSLLWQVYFSFRHDCHWEILNLC